MPASYMMRQIHEEEFELDPEEDVAPICTSQESVIAAFKLIRSLCTGCNENLETLKNELFSLYYSTKDNELTVWEYFPMMGPRPAKGFVGLKNAGATCYMNSVIQQLFMVPAIQGRIISLPKEKLLMPQTSVDKTVDGSDEKTEDGESKLEEKKQDSPPEVQNIDLERRAYHVSVLAEMQAIFGHLSLSKLQYYTPQGFWKAFKLWGEPVNLKEQHDALEFYNSLVDSLDEGTKFIFGTKGASEELAGNFASQKICKDCPHRYVKEEQFTALSVEVRNQSHLLESLDLFVKGDLLEGNNAFFCEKCNKKVDTIMRTCIRHLPKVLVIQLKRFDYDWERETAIKFNDYFEFPRDLDLAPYTEYYLAKKEDETIPETSDDGSSKYSLSGIVVHSGQAYGGHYYSFIKYKCNNTGESKWYKFDDMEVTEFRMDDYDELRNNCFGGEFQGEVYDPIAKRMQFRRQKRWWNAYLLIYERTAEADATTAASNTNKSKAPVQICKSVQKENLEYLFTKIQFGIEYFGFMKDLFKSNKLFILEHMQDNSETGPKSKEELENLALHSIQLASKFLFGVGFHTKKSLRGLANEWYECYQALINNYASCRKWLADEILFKKPMFRFCEYLLDCPSADIRIVFTKILVCLAKYSVNDGIYYPPRVPFGPENEDKRDEDEQESHTFSLLLRSTKPQTLPVPESILQIDTDNAELRDHIMISCVNLLAYDLSPCAKYLSQYFAIFQMYCKLGRPECDHLLKLGIPELFMAAALHEGPGPPIISQSLDLTKLFSFVAILLRCYDISHLQESSNKEAPLENSFKNGEPYCVIPENIQNKLFNKTSMSLHTSYVNKMLEECPNSEECITLLKFCCWENWDFSLLVISEVIFEPSNSHNYELRKFMDLMLNILMLEDSWQRKRVLLTLKGIANDVDSLFDIIHNSRMHYQKRAYLALKLILQIVQFCPFTKEYLMNDYTIKRRYMMAVDWLNDELSRRMMTSAYSNYNNAWSHSTSNETSTNSLFLERTNSAQNLLANAKLYYVPDQVTPPLAQDSGDETNSQEEGDKTGPGGDSSEVMEGGFPSPGETHELTSHSSHPENLDKIGQTPPPPPPPPPPKSPTSTD